MFAKFLMAAATFALIAWLIETGVQLIESVLPQLAVLGAVFATFRLGWWWFRGRSDGW